MELYDVLNFTNAARTHRLKAAKWVLDHPEIFEELVHVCFKNDKEAINWIIKALNGLKVRT